MSVFHRAVDRLTDLIRRDHNVTYRAFIHARLAPYVTPLLDKIVAEGEDGDTLRNALIPWGRAERPSIAIYRGDISTCRIDGPWQRADGDWLPLGGLIVTSGVTAHLDPFEARALEERPDLTVRGLAAELVERGYRVSPNTVWSLLRKAGYSFKKKPVRDRTGSSANRPASGTVEEISGQA